MAKWALQFLVAGLAAGFLGFGVVSGTAAWFAQVLFAVFLSLFLLSVLPARKPKLR